MKCKHQITIKNIYSVFKTIALISSLTLCTSRRSAVFFGGGSLWLKIINKYLEYFLSALSALVVKYIFSNYQRSTKNYKLLSSLVVKNLFFAPLCVLCGEIFSKAINYNIVFLSALSALVVKYIFFNYQLNNAR